MKTIYCLAIESTAHTFGCAIIEFKKDFKVLSNIRNMYRTDKGGIIPNQLAEHHVGCFDKVILDALSIAKKNFSDISLIAFSQGPGIGHALRIGAVVARSLAIQLHKPLVGVNHCIAHLEIGTIFGSVDPVLLYASGANTQVIAFDCGKYRIFGETLDVGIGNFLDSIGRELGLGFPAGPIIDEMAAKAKRRGDKYIPLQYQVKGMDVTFSGLFTSIRNDIRKGKYNTLEQKEQLCYSLQETVFSMLIEVSERALAHCEKTELVLGGGVACNTRLQEMARIMCKERGSKCIIPEKEFLIDNAAMIGVLGIKMHQAGHKCNIVNSRIKPYERTDDIVVDWGINKYKS